MHFRYLEGIRFTDFAWAGAGSFATKIFSDFGAEIVKMESTRRPDNTRLAGPFKDGIAGLNRSGYFSSRNTGKKSFTVDLKSPEGMKLVRGLIERSDVVSNNFAAGAMERLGLSYDEVRSIRPDIIYLTMPMYGESGPLAKMPGLGMTISAVTGLTGLTGYHGGPPVGPGTHFPDHAANPYHAAFAVMAALRHRRVTGRGMKIDLSQVESMHELHGAAVPRIHGHRPRAGTHRQPLARPRTSQHLCLAGEDRWCAIAVLDDAQWPLLCKAIDRADLAADQALATAKGRLQRVDEIEQAVAAWTAGRDARAIMQTLQAAGVPAGMVANARDLMEDDPQLKHRAFWQGSSIRKWGRRASSLAAVPDRRRARGAEAGAADRRAHRRDPRRRSRIFAGAHRRPAGGGRPRLSALRGAPNRRPAPGRTGREGRRRRRAAGPRSPRPRCSPRASGL